MKITHWKDLVIALILILVLSLFFPNLESLWMTTPFMPGVFFLVVILSIVFGIFVWQEKAIDEREVAHLAQASRLAFLTGAALLLTGVIISAKAGTLDPWLLIALIAMLATKVLARLYFSIRY